MQHGVTAAAVQRGGGVPPLIVAHRGAWGEAPQNSLEAVEQAITLGCDAIEIDVRRTADGRIVLVHDARVRFRTVGRLEHHQVQARLQAGQAPLLEHVLERAAGRIFVDVELKENGYVGQTMALVTRHLTPGEFVITSFRESILAEVRRHAPQARAGLLIGPRWSWDIARRVKAARPDFLAAHAGLARFGMFAWAEQRGLPIWAWTVNHQPALRYLGDDPRVEALITDQPERALSMFTSC